MKSIWRGVLAGLMLSSCSVYLLRKHYHGTDFKSMFHLTDQQQNNVIVRVHVRGTDEIRHSAIEKMNNTSRNILRAIL